MPTTSSPPGFDFAFYHESIAFAFGADLRLCTTRESSSKQANFASLSLGPRYFITRTDFSPYIGAGFSWSGLGLESNDLYRFGSGISTFGELGLEAFRTSKVRLSLGIRLNVPFYKARVPDSPVLDLNQAESKRSGTDYALPTTVALTFFF